MRLILPLFVLIVGAMAQNDGETFELMELLVKSNNQFTAKMLDSVVAKSAGKSVVMSAFSVLTPLAQLTLASVGPTHDELLRAIGLPNDNVVTEVFTGLHDDLQAVKGVEFRTASRIYIPTGNELDEKFAAFSLQAFNTDAKNVDFKNKIVTANEINTWVDKATNNRIKNLVNAEAITPDTKALLVNAIYFKGKWAEPFEKKLTTARDFHVTKDNNIQVPTMHRQGKYPYTESAELDAKILVIPYQDNEASFVVALPNKVDGIATLLNKLKDPTTLTNATQSLLEYDVDVFLPSFKIETQIDLKDVLINQNVNKLFSVDAQLEKLIKNSKNIYISGATQKAFIEVNEEGAEAAAVNAFIATMSAPFPPTIKQKFVADHPFVFGIVIEEVLIFNGVYYSP